MNQEQLVTLGKRVLTRLDPRLVAAAERALKSIPWVRARLAREYDGMLDKLEPTTKPYRDRFPAMRTLPTTGRERAEVLRELTLMAAEEAPRWQDGFVSGAVYQGDAAHVEFMNHVYALASQTNPLHADLFPSITKLEAEVVAMTATMLGADMSLPEREQVCGTLTSGGTESIILAMKTYRDRALAGRPRLRALEIVAPVTAHAAFDKAAHLLGMKLVRVPVGADGRVEVAAVRRALTSRTVVVVGSAPCFPYGVIDPIAELSELARRRGLGFHCDACLGGFVLPWAERLGYAVPPFDFRLPGVTSMSADTHKFGYAAKGSSVVLYRGHELRAHQYYTIADWPGGLYFSPTLAGSRSGALGAACWAALVTTGESGYLEATRQILATADVIKRGLAAIPELELIGAPLFVIAFRSRTRDVFRVLDAMGRRRWSLNGLHRPAAVHLCVTLRHTQPGVAERFLADLRAAVAEAAGSEAHSGDMAPVYGLAATLPLNGVIGDLLKRYIDVLYRV